MLEQLLNDVNLSDCELFLCTDNLVAECAYYKDLPSSISLFFIFVLRLRKVHMAGNMILHVIHMSGKRMINCKIDEFSRGITNEGVMKGVSILRYLPFDKGALERSKGLLPWIKTWWPREETIVYLSHNDWYEKVFTRG